MIIALAMPRSDHQVSYYAMLGKQYASKNAELRILDIELPPCSLLNHNFNRHWAEALNLRDDGQGATHFAMIHADVCPQEGWLDVLLGELTANDADVVSAVIPIKDDRGLTTTAVYDGVDPWNRRRFTLKEIHRLPATFGAEDVGEALLINTGLWVCDLRKPWCDDCCFHSLERIVRKDGRYAAEVLSEDWAFGHFLNGYGAKVLATRKVQVLHEGGHRFPNTTPWGAWETDGDYLMAGGRLEAVA